MFRFFIVLLFYIFTKSYAYSLTNGDNKIYGTKVVSGGIPDTRAFGTIAPSDGSFTSVQNPITIPN